jgi:uncharacterized protein (TIGR02186 family)
MPNWRACVGLLTAVVLITAAALIVAALPSNAQRRRTPAPERRELPERYEPTRKQQPGVKESLEADVSARNVRVGPGFSGVEIVVFGAIDNSQQPSPESGYYDLIIVVEGVPRRVVARHRSNVAGMWVNTSSVTFENVPTFYAIASTRPLDEIAPDDLRTLYRIGLRHLRLVPAFAQEHALSRQDLDEFREAVARLKQRAGLFIQAPFAARFTGKNLFSSTVRLPANVTVGPFDTRIYLFHEQKLLSEFTVRLYLEREGIERYLYAFAFDYPALYGLSSVVLAATVGLLAARLFGGDRAQ